MSHEAPIPSLQYHPGITRRERDHQQRPNLSAEVAGVSNVVREG